MIHKDQSTLMGPLARLALLVLILAGLVTVGLLIPTPAMAGVCPAPAESGGASGVTLDECVTTTHFVVYYTTDNADSPHDIDSESEAQLLAEQSGIRLGSFQERPRFRPA